MRLELCLFNIIFIQSRLGFGFFLCVFADKPFHPLPVLQNVTCPTTSFTDLAEIVSRIEPVKAPVADGEWGQGQRQLLPCSGRGLSLEGDIPCSPQSPRACVPLLPPPLAQRAQWGCRCCGQALLSASPWGE